MSITRFERLPAELLYEIQLYALSEHLPHTSKKLYTVFKHAPTSLNAQYIYYRVAKILKISINITNAILRYPICTIQIFQFIRTNLFLDTINTSPELPKRLFRHLTAKKPPTKWRDMDDLLQFLEFLYDSERSKIPPPDPNSHQGYALMKAVHVGFTQLVRFLLSRGATPANDDDKKNGLTVMIAIRQKDLGMVKMLVERRSGEGEVRKGGGNQRRKMGDRISVTTEMLQMAVKCKAQDIVEYFMKEKGGAYAMLTDFALVKLVDTTVTRLDTVESKYFFFLLARFPSIDVRGEETIVLITEVMEASAGCCGRLCARYPFSMRAACPGCSPAYSKA